MSEVNYNGPSYLSVCSDGAYICRSGDFDMFNYFGKIYKVNRLNAECTFVPDSLAEHFLQGIQK